MTTMLRTLCAVLACAAGAAALACGGGDVQTYATYDEAARAAALPPYVPGTAHTFRAAEEEGARWMSFQVPAGDAQRMVDGMRILTFSQARTGRFHPARVEGRLAARALPPRAHQLALVHPLLRRLPRGMPGGRVGELHRVRLPVRGSGLTRIATTSEVSWHSAESRGHVAHPAQKPATDREPGAFYLCAPGAAAGSTLPPTRGCSGSAAPIPIHPSSAQSFPWRE